MSKSLKITTGSDSTNDVPTAIQTQSNSVLVICIFMGLITAMMAVVFFFGVAMALKTKKDTGSYFRNGGRRG
jgi:hypothetical protein